MLIKDRHKYLELCVDAVAGGDVDRDLIVSIVLSENQTYAARTGTPCSVTVDSKDKSYFGDWLVWEWDIFWLRRKSEESYQQFKAGDVDAIFRFCAENPFALRIPWVLNRIEMWWLDNTAKSLESLNRLFRTYAGMRGKTTTERLAELLKRDLRIYLSVKIRLLNDERPNTALRSVAHEFAVSYETARAAFYTFKRLAPKLRTLYRDYRGIIIGFPDVIPPADDIPIILAGC